MGRPALLAFSIRSIRSAFVCLYLPPIATERNQEALIIDYRERGAFLGTKVFLFNRNSIQMYVQE
jgi:hypothetical protein